MSLGRAVHGRAVWLVRRGRVLNRMVVGSHVAAKLIDFPARSIRYYDTGNRL